MKKGQPLCAREVDTALGLEKLVSVFSIVAFGYILSSAIGVREEDGQRYSSFHYKKSLRITDNLIRPSLDLHSVRWLEVHNLSVLNVNIAC